MSTNDLLALKRLIEEHITDDSAAADWLIEEAAELKAATSEAEALDAVFDALGICLLRLGLSEPADVVAAYHEYTQSQLRRGRELCYWHPLIKQMVATIAHGPNDQPDSRYSQAAGVIDRRKEKHGRGLERLAAAINDQRARR